MSKEYHSIFNHALAPITPGPSSSNTCGPVRIGLICRQLLGETPARAVVEYSAEGAFPSTLYGMRSDIAFINGLLGREQNEPGFGAAYEKAAEAGMDAAFRSVGDLTVGGMETVRIRMTARDGAELTVIGESVGGGAVRIHSIDGCPVNICGTNYELVLFVRGGRDAAEALAGRVLPQIKKVNGYEVAGEGRLYIVDIKTAEDLPKEALAGLGDDPAVERARVVRPVHPVISDVTRTPPFETPEEMIAYCEARRCSPARAAIDYETAVSGWSERRVRDYAQTLLKIMEDSRDGGFRSDLEFEGIVRPRAAALREKIGRGKMPSLGVLNAAIPAALGIMEHSNASGRIVCVPTGGSSGIVPALLLSAAEECGAAREELYESLMAAGMIGVLMMVDGNEFAGGTHGCQAEIACGAAMAAAGLVQMMGGTAKQACDSASVSLQCFLGLICDPVAGLVQVPCLARNIAGVSVAASSAEAVCAGFDAVIPLDEMSRIMVRVGTEVTAAIGMCRGGCCQTPTGLRLTEEYDALREGKRA